MLAIRLDRIDPARDRR